MLETAETMEQMEMDLDFVRIIRTLLNMHGRMRCTAAVAADFVKVNDADMTSIFAFSAFPPFSSLLLLPMLYRNVDDRLEFCL